MKQPTQEDRLVAAMALLVSVFVVGFAAWGHQEVLAGVAGTAATVGIIWQVYR